MEEIRMNKAISWKYTFIMTLLVSFFVVTSMNVSAGSDNSNLLPLSQKDWSLHYVDSEHTAGEDGKATNAFDGNEETYWHSKHPPADALPHEIQTDLGGVHEIA